MDHNPTLPQDGKKPYRTPQFNKLTPTDEERHMLILELRLAAMELRATAAKIDTVVARLAEPRLAPPRAVPTFRRNTLSDAERDALDQRRQRQPGDFDASRHKPLETLPDAPGAPPRDDSAIYYPEYERARAAVMGMDRDELLAQIDTLYGRENLPPYPSLDELRSEALDQTARDFKRTPPPLHWTDIRE